MGPKKLVTLSVCCDTINRSLFAVDPFASYYKHVRYLLNSFTNRRTYIHGKKLTVRFSIRIAIFYQSNFCKTIFYMLLRHLLCKILKILYYVYIILKDLIIFVYFVLIHLHFPFNCTKIMFSLYF